MKYSGITLKFYPLFCSSISLKLFVKISVFDFPSILVTLCGSPKVAEKIEFNTALLPLSIFDQLSSNRSQCMVLEDRNWSRSPLRPI